MDPIDLFELLRPLRTGETSFLLDVPEGVQQGRGAWGGVATGAMASAAQQVDPRPEMALRTLSAQLVAPLLVGRARLEIEVLRRGAATTTVAARIVDAAGSLTAHGVVVLGAPRPVGDVADGSRWTSIEPPAELAAGPDGIAVVPLGPPLAPKFLQHLEVRPVSGIPYTGGQTPSTSGWIRPIAPVSDVDASISVAMADAWWVAVMARLDRPRPVGTMGFTVDLPTDPRTLPREPDGRLRPLLHRGTTLAARDGYTMESRELWTEDGRLATWNAQTVAVIK